MITYDPNSAPDPTTWLAASESDRIDAIEEFHQGLLDEVEGAQMHIMIHTVIENQAAIGDEIPIGEAIDRLMGEGIDRHDAIHAVGYVFAGHLWESQKFEKDFDEAGYFDEVRELTVAKWRESLEDPTSN